MLGRVRARVPDVTGDDPCGWAMPCLPFGGSQTGFFAIPGSGAGVWIEFEHGDPDYPIWSGCWWGSVADLPPLLLAPPYQKVMIQTGGGQVVTLDDTPGIGGITFETSGGAKLEITELGITIDNGQGASIMLTANQVIVNDGALEVM